MKTDSALKNVDLLKNKKILIIGDVGLDEYVIGAVKRISPEAPVPVVEVLSEDKRLGLSSNVAANVASLGGEAWLVGVVGADATAEQFRMILKQNHCTDKFLIVDETRPTTRKLRIMAGQHHVVRVDFERKKFLSPDVQEKLFMQVESVISLCDAVILEDYAKGVLDEKLIQKIITLAHKNGKLVTLDPNSSTPVDHYKGVDFLTPNTDEALALSSLKFDDLRSPSDSFEEVGDELLQKLAAKAVIITRGKDGMSIFTREKTNAPLKVEHIPTFARTVFDVTGAGDTVIATFTLAMTAGLTLGDACILSNYAAGVVVGKVGCVSATPQELKKYIEDLRK